MLPAAGAGVKDIQEVGPKKLPQGDRGFQGPASPQRQVKATARVRAGPAVRSQQDGRGLPAAGLAKGE